MRIFLLLITPKMWYNNKNIAKFQFVVQLHEMQNAKCKVQNGGICFANDLK